MSYNYLDLIAEDESSFLRSRFALICISLFLAIIIILMEKNEHDTLGDYHKMNIKVSQIGISKIIKKPNATFNINKGVEVEVLIIRSEKYFFLVDKNLKEFWAKIMNELKQGENALLFYQIIDGYKEIVQIEHDSGPIFTLRDLSGKFLILKWTCYFLLGLSIIFLFILYHKRAKWLKS
jgi:hypothetical protein